MSIGLFVINENECINKKTYIEYSEYKKMNKSDKLKFLSIYVKNNDLLSFIDKNLMNIISIIGALATFVFGFISLL